jgi:hypothetical protein
MAASTIKEFLAVVADNKELEAEVGRLLKATPDPKAALDLVSGIGAKNGFNFSSADLSAFLAQPKGSGELSAQELDGVAGGVFNWAKACTGSESVYCYICAMGTTG